MPELLIDRPHFFAELKTIRKKKGLSQAQVDGFNAIFDAWDEVPELDFLDWIAYILATAWHETGEKMQPVRETFAATDEQAFQRVTAFCLKKGKDNYARRHPNGNSYYGRGYVQLTHAVNYKTAGQKLGIGDRLFDRPDDVLDPKMGARIIVNGMIGAWFTSHKLTDHLNSHIRDWKNARRIINGLDKADTIAGHAKMFVKCLKFQ